MNKILLIVGLSTLIICATFVSSYICINQNDNDGVHNFKMKLNNISANQDLNNGMTPEAINLKLKYFGPCNK